MRSLDWIISANEKAYQEQRKDKAPARGLYPIPPTTSDVNDPEVKPWPKKAAVSPVTEQRILEYAIRIAIAYGCSAETALARAREEWAR